MWLQENLQCKGALEGERLVFIGEIRKRLLEGADTWAGQERETGWRQPRTGELQDGRAQVKAGKGSTEYVVTQYPWYKSRPRKRAQMWVPGPYQKFPFRSSAVGRAQGPEFFRSTQSASLHSEARGLPFPDVAESGAVCGADRRASRKEWWTERGVAQKPH